LAKKGWGYILGDLLTNSSGHPGEKAKQNAAVSALIVLLDLVRKLYIAAHPISSADLSSLNAFLFLWPSHSLLRTDVCSHPFLRRLGAIFKAYRKKVRLLPA
jgi:hypothetical protein